MCIVRNCIFWFGSVDDWKFIVIGYYWEISDIDGWCINYYENVKMLKCFGVLYNGEFMILILN